MRLKSFQYSEHMGTPNEWVLEPFPLGQINLLVGKNAAGKSRVISVISALQRLIGGRQKELYRTGDFDVTLADDIDEFKFKLSLTDNCVKSESLSKNGQSLYSRDSDGKGKIWAEKLAANLDFEIPKNTLVIHSRRDKAQHSYLEPIHEWASALRVCLFGTSLGRDKLKTVQELDRSNSSDNELLDLTEVHELYNLGFMRFHEEFDKAILRDLAQLGYDAEDVGLSPINLPQFKNVPFATLFVKERDLPSATTQLNMSQGMFRALALAIQFSFCELTGIPRTILIDDVGEGLDFERSKGLVNLLVEKATKSNFQLVMTTNDRFVMNGADLKYWGVVSRHGARVSVINAQNTPQVFEEYESLGLNNFDFFSTRFFETGLIND